MSGNFAVAHTLFTKSVVAHMEDRDVRGHEGAPRRGGGPLGRQLHHFLGEDGTGLAEPYQC